MKIFAATLLMYCCLLLLNNANGQKTYIKETEAENDIFLNDMIITNDGNTIISHTDPEPHTLSDMCMAKLNSRGKALWSKKYILDSVTYGSTAKMLPCEKDGFIAFNSFIDHGTLRGSLVFKADSSGSIKWAKLLSTNSKDYIIGAVSVAIAKDGALYTISQIYEYGLYIQKLNKNGSPLWHRYVYTDSTIDVQTRFGTVTTTPDNGLIFSTIFFKRFEDKYYSHLFKLSKDGQPEWQYTATRAFDYYIPLMHVQSSDNGTLRLLYRNYNRFKYVRLDPATGKSEIFDAGKSIFDLQRYLRENAIHAFDNISFLVPSYNVYAFTKDWSILLANPFETQWRKYKVRIQKFDSLGRICPDYKLPDIKSSLGKIKFRFTKSTFNISNPPITLQESDVPISIQSLDLIQLICYGEAPAPLAKTLTPVLNKNDVNIKVRIVPNPVQDYITIIANLPASCLSKIEITDIKGVVLKSATLNMARGQNQKIMNIAELPAGTYIVKLLTPNGINTQKVIKL